MILKQHACSRRRVIAYVPTTYDRELCAHALFGKPAFMIEDGLSFKARTILLESEGDQVILEVLQSPVIKDGLKLMDMVQPALPQLAALGDGRSLCGHRCRQIYG